MDIQKVDLFIAQKKDFFPAEKIPFIREKLLTMDDDKYLAISSVDFINPTHFILFSIFLGNYGVDRFMIGDIGVGVLKLLTLGGCGILWIYDVVVAVQKAKEKNFNVFMNFIIL